MSDNEHVKAIREVLDAAWLPISEYGGLDSDDLNAILSHADALAAELAEARKEIAYWKSCVEDPVIYWGFDEKPYGYLDDLDAAPGDTAGE